MEVVIWLVFPIATVTVLAILAVPLVLTSRERLRVDMERRLAELRLQRMTSQALLRLMDEARAPGPNTDLMEVFDVLSEEDR